jgi:anti-sigma B factor antagonist
MAMLAFGIEESHDRDGVARLTVVGELDLAVADHLVMRLRVLLDGGNHVRIDLSRLQFIDSRGMHALIRAVALGREAGGKVVEIDPTVAANVRHALELAGVARMLWPDATSAAP